MTDGALATICIVPRERYSLALASLDSVLAEIPANNPVVYVDGQSPPDIGQALAERCRARGASYRRADSGLPLIHMAGGDLREERVDGVPTIHQSHRFMRRVRFSVQSLLHREPCGFFEFHCVLLRRDCFERGCSLDPELTALHEHLDLAMQIHRAGGEVYFEPQAVIRYDNATPFTAADRDFFERRWSEEWTDGSLEHFREKWGMAPNDAGLQATRYFAASHRRLFEHTQKSWLHRALPLIVRREGGQLLRYLKGMRRV